ncbi:hypothetical protein HJC23_013336 [Cyclotella cryptica]|uniref:Response regulatory domain-containing protein n=1 Tax=Cyclotella cryptica TaxID=29204 RepID=A0ABD3Q1E6_9STRA|eukprot:CCRYP_009755-RB/>CCRYP_009755-RB protein AED:0.03 eAED:0.03 QI:180/1/1/1/0.5/0.33/3/170/527
MEKSPAFKPGCHADSGINHSKTNTSMDGPPTLISKLSSLCSVASAESKDPTLSPTPLSPSSQRRAIFDKFWKKNASSSSIRDDDDSASVSDLSTKRIPGTKIEPSYLGIYSFAPPSPLTSPKPGLKLINSPSDDRLTPTPNRPKSILRRHHSARGLRTVQPIEEEGGKEGKHRSLSACSASEMKASTAASLVQLSFAPQLPFAPELFQDDISSNSEEADWNYLSRKPPLAMRNHSVHFDPTITVREVVGGISKKENESCSNWFSEDELQTFFKEAVHLCHASAISSIKTYSPPEVAKEHARAAKAGIKDPVVCSSLPEYRALFAEPILHVTDEDAIVHNGSAAFFRLTYKMVRNVLIVNGSHNILKLLQQHMMSMFPHANVDLAVSGEDALSQMQVDSSGAISSRPYDVVIVDEKLHSLLEGSEHKDGEDLEHATPVMTGSQLLQHINESKYCHPDNREPTSASAKQHISLMIGISANMSEDCDSLQKGGADLLWALPPPKPSNCLRNQLLNTLLSKRGKSVFICGC